MFEIEERIIPDRFQQEGRLRLYWLASRGLLASILIGGFHLLLFILGDSLPSSPIDPRTHILATSSFASAILSFALIALYRNMSEIQDRQSKFLEAQTKPNLVSESTFPVEDESYPVFQLRLSNIGGGQADDLKVKIEPEILKTSRVAEAYPLSQEDATELLNDGVVFEEIRDLDREDRLAQDITTSQNHLESGETEVYLRPATLLVYNPVFEDKRSYGWESAIKTLDSIGVDDLRLKFQLQYSGFTGEGDPTLISDIVIPVDDSLSITEAFRKGKSISRYHTNPNAIHN